MIKSYLISVVLSKEQENLLDKIGGRIYTMDGVEDVTISEVVTVSDGIPDEVLVPLAELEKHMTNPTMN
jgi:hypothetical protein